MDTDDDVIAADRISELEDGILENILSRLTISEAVATSFISKRFQHLWTYSSGTYYFNFGSAVVITELQNERLIYIMRVQKFINSHNGPTIDAFRIKFDLQSGAALVIDDWIRFAIRKKVRMLELDLRRLGWKHKEKNWASSFITVKDAYCFPSVESLDENMKLNLHRLISLNLNFVDLTRETVEYILSDCPLLEYVRILNSPNLDGVKVVEMCRKLKKLEIAHCHKLEFLDIYCAPNLVSLLYSGPSETRVCFRDAPKLVNVSLQGEYCMEIIDNFGELCLDLSRIQVLNLNFRQSMLRFGRFTGLNSVTQLELEIKASEKYSLLACNQAIQACPNLCTLLIKFNWSSKPNARREPLKLLKKYSHEYKLLKVIQVSGFRGSTTDVELVTFILLKAPLVEKIEVDTIPFDYVMGTNAADFEENLHAKNLATQLASQLSPTAQLLVR